MSRLRRERERRQLVDRKWNFPAVCWRAEVLSEQTPRCDSSERSGSRAAEQHCPAAAGEG